MLFQDAIRITSLSVSETGSFSERNFYSWTIILQLLQSMVVVASWGDLLENEVNTGPRI